MGKRIVGYVISHTGKPGGPWEADGDEYGAAVTTRCGRAEWPLHWQKEAERTL